MSRCRSHSLQGRNNGKNDFLSSGSSICTQQQVPTIKLTADDYDVPVEGFRLPIADAFVSQRSSTSSISRTSSTTSSTSSVSSTLSADTLMPCPSTLNPSSSKPIRGTSTSTPLPSFSTPPASSYSSETPHLPPTAVLRGDGPELFDGGGRSYVSETSSVHTVRPCAIKNSIYRPGVSSPRRDNPKTSGSNTDRGDGSLFVPAPREKPVCDVVAEYQGLKLCRVSDCVPYLLGTRNLRIRLASITEDNLSHTPSLCSSPPLPISSSSSSTAAHTYTPLDLALLAILHSLATTTLATRQQTRNWYPQGLATKHSALLLYENSAKSGPIPISVSLPQFVHMAQTWCLTRNPMNLSGDVVSAKNNWNDIAAALREHGVDLGKIDTQLYWELTCVAEGVELKKKIEQVGEWGRDGRLEIRWNKWYEYVEDREKEKMVGRTGAVVATATSATMRRSRDLQGAERDAGGGGHSRTYGLYTKRFTHKHPLGRPRSLISDAEKAERRAERADKASAAASAAALAAEKLDKKNRLTRCWADKKRRNGWLFPCIVMAVLGSVVGVLVWAMAMHKLWAGAGEVY